MEDSILYFPESYEIGGYDILFCRALSNLGSKCQIAQDLGMDSLATLKNNEIIYQKIDFNFEYKNIENRVVSKYFCNKCQTLLSWKNISMGGSPEMRTLGFLRNDNIFLLFPYYSSREMPTEWKRIEGKKNVYYVDVKTYSIFKEFLRKGTAVDDAVIKISFPQSINFPNLNPENIGLMNFKYGYDEKRCRFCNTRVEKKVFKEVKMGNEIIGYTSLDGKIHWNEDGKLISFILSNKDKIIYLPIELYSSKKKLLSTLGGEIRPYSRVMQSEILINKSSRAIRNMKQLTHEGDDYIDSIAIGYVNSLKKELMDAVIQGDYDKAVKTFYRAIKIFDLFFIQGCRDSYGIPKTAINILDDIFESLFNGENYKITLEGKELDERWKNFIDLFANVERIKGKVKARSYTLNNIVISTIKPLPPEDEMKKILKVKDLKVIQGIWHGVKFIVKPNIEKIGKYYKNYASKIAFLLGKKEAKDIIAKIEKGDYYLGIEGQSLRITREMVTVVPKLPDGYMKGMFNLGEFYLSVDKDACQDQINKLARKINYERHRLRMKREDPVDVMVPINDCKEEVELSENTIVKKTNARRILYGDDFKIIPFYRGNIAVSISRYLGVGMETAESMIERGIENLYILQIADPLTLPIKDQEIRAKVIESRNRKIEPIDQIDKVFCALCDGEVENKVCSKCGFNYGAL